MKSFEEEILEGIPASIPDAPREDPSISRAPKRRLTLNRSEQELAVRNALRYFPHQHHAELGKEFMRELDLYVVFERESREFQLYLTLS